MASSFSVSVRLVAAVHDVTVSRSSFHSSARATLLFHSLRSPPVATQSQKNRANLPARQAITQNFSCKIVHFYKQSTIQGVLSETKIMAWFICRVWFAAGRSGRFSDHFHLFNVVQNWTFLSLCYKYIVITLLGEHYESNTFSQASFRCPAQMESLASELTHIHGQIMN